MSVAERLRRQLLKEEVVGMPSYMTMSREDASEVLSSFGAIFTSIINSVKLIGQTISLNLKVIANSFKGDQAAIKKNFEDFSVKRDEIHASMEDDLKYFKKAVGDSPLERASWDPWLSLRTRCSYIPCYQAPETSGNPAAWVLTLARIRKQGLRPSSRSNLPRV